MSGGSDLRAASIEERRAKLRAQLEQVEAQLVELRELRKSESADDEHDPEGVSSRPNGPAWKDSNSPG